jgi:hypothetical protein
MASTFVAQAKSNRRKFYVTLGGNHRGIYICFIRNKITFFSDWDAIHWYNRVPDSNTLTRRMAVCAASLRSSPTISPFRPTPICVMQVWFWREETMLMRYFGEVEIANAKTKKPRIMGCLACLQGL